VSNQEQFTRKSYGPFLVKASGAAVPTEFLTLPWVEVRRANILVAATDDIDVNPATAGNLTPPLMMASEVTIYGSIQGFFTPIKTACVSGKLPPLQLKQEDIDAYEYISFRQRLMMGGRPATPPGGSAAQLAALLVNMAVQVYVMPRSGYKKVQHG
jgi:hypothetical protein